MFGESAFSDTAFSDEMLIVRVVLGSIEFALFISRSESVTASITTSINTVQYVCDDLNIRVAR